MHFERNFAFEMPFKIHKIIFFTENLKNSPEKLFG